MGMGMMNGQVTVNDSPTKSKLYRFCEKKIDQWVKSHSPAQEAGEMPTAEFQVSFIEESHTKQVSCVTEVRLGGALYRGCDLDCDTQQAFIHSLRRLQPH